MDTDPIRGKTIRFTFDDGPMAKKSVDHTFNDDGSLDFAMSGDDKKQQKPTHVDKYEVATVGSDVTIISYLGSGGYTLTVALDMKAKKLVAFSSNEKSVSVQHGSFQEISGAKSKEHDPDRTQPAH
ncbi:MAG: hypothetical protein ABI183_00795 [Polyangiaceae bacterium]